MYIAKHSKHRNHFARSMNTKTTIIGMVIAEGERETELIREYEEAMISEAVMEKIL